MKECWINVYEKDIGIKQRTRIKAYLAFFKGADVFGKLQYRIHVKMKDKPGLSREYLLKFDNQFGTIPNVNYYYGPKGIYKMTMIEKVARAILESGNKDWLATTEEWNNVAKAAIEVMCESNCK